MLHAKRVRVTTRQDTRGIERNDPKRYSIDECQPSVDEERPATGATGERVGRVSHLVQNRLIELCTGEGRQLRMGQLVLLGLALGTMRSWRLATRTDAQDKDKITTTRNLQKRVHSLTKFRNRSRDALEDDRNVLSVANV